MNLPFVVLVYTLALLCIFSGHASSETLEYWRKPIIPIIETTIDLNNKNREESDKLFKHIGEVVYLDLKIIPKRINDKGDVGYTLSQKNWVPKPDMPEANEIKCGIDEEFYLGLIDNLDKKYYLKFGDPEAPLHFTYEFHIGDKSNYPFHTIVCDTTGYIDEHWTPLLIKGHFVIVNSGRPTVSETTYFPYNPY